MPFTLAHPAAVLPLRGSPFLLAAPLIIGAVAPDIPYFVPGIIERTIPETHEFESSYTVCLALGYVLLLAIFILRQPLTALLSPRARWLCLQALEPFRTRWSAWLFAPLAIVVGVWTHLLWDSFTHADGWFARRISALTAPVTVGNWTGPLCHVLQYASSVFGLAVMVIWYLRRPAPRRVPLTPGAPRSAVGPILVLVATAALLIGGVQATEYHHLHPAEVYRSINILLTHSLAWFGVLYLVAGVVITLEHKSEAAL